MEIDSVAARFLTLALAGDRDDDALSQARALASAGTLKWDAVRLSARRRGLAPLLYRTTNGLGSVPARVLEEWRRLYYLNLARNTYLFRAAARILAALSDSSVPVILLKGAALAHSVYKDPGVRPMTDVDLLVLPADVSAAEQILSAAGFAPLRSEQWPGFSRRYGNGAPYTLCTTARHRFQIGMHWRLFDVPYYDRIDTEGWFERTYSTNVGGSDGLLPANEDHLVYLCGHFALHHQYDNVLRLNDVAALLDYAGESFDWDGALQRAEEWRLALPLTRVLRRLEELWPGTVPLQVMGRASNLRPTAGERWVHRWAAERLRTPATDLVLALVTMPGVGRRLRYLLEIAVPSPAYMRQRYAGNYPLLWPLTYIWRAGRALHHLVAPHA